jgi:hypothetical protein
MPNNLTTSVAIIILAIKITAARKSIGFLNYLI